MKWITLWILSLFVYKLHAQDTLTQSKSLIAAGKLQEAALLLNTYCKSNTDTTALLLCADTWYELGIYNTALEHYTSLLYITPNNLYARRQRALSASLHGNYKSAAEEWKQVCGLLPADKYNWYFLAQAQSNLSNDDAALVAWNKAIKIDTFFTEALIARSKLYLKTKKYEDALSDIDSCLKVLQYQDYLFHDRGLALLGLKRYKEAERMFETNIKHNEKNVHAWFGIGMCYTAQRNYVKAIDAFDIAVTLKPDFEIAYFRRGLAKLELNKQNLGCEDLMKAHNLGYPDALFYLKKYCNRD